MIQPKYQYQVVAYDECRNRADGNGYYYTNSCDITLISEGEKDALAQAAKLVVRQNYQVFNIQELPQ